MSSAVSFSGFNNIDFNLILNSIMGQESQPLVALQSRQNALQSRIGNFATLSTRVSALQQAAEALASTDALTAFTASSSDTTAVSVTAGSSALPGRYEIVVNELGRAQVMVSTTSAPDADTTVVSNGGALTFGGETVTITGPVTLRQLADAINANADVPVQASVIQASANTFRLVLTAKTSGQDNAFTVANTLTGGTGVAFTDTDSDGVSGDSAADNVQQALNASLLVNNIPVSSATNTLDNVVPGATLTLLKKDPASTVVVDVAADPQKLKDKIASFVTAYNDLVKFATDQATSAGQRDPSSIGRDPVVRELRTALRNALSTAYGSGATSYLSEVGISFTQTGTIAFDGSTFDEAVENGTDVEALFVGGSGTPGAFASLETLLGAYTDIGGILPNTKEQLDAQVSRLTDQIQSLQDRLALRRAALQREFTAADAAMSRLKNQSGSLASFGAQI
jgi:flagellar hook-associated protein 2